ncbi:MAG: hypothetical protein PUC06_01580 [Oscillospiraceae bacterium]|nr:hypothetical protein [Oscillospiraceae bacterium]
MAKADILFDKTEFVLRMADKQAMTMNIRADQIQTITIQPTMVKKLFKKVESEVILIKMKGGAGGPGGGPGGPGGGPGGGDSGMPLQKEAFEAKEKGSWEKCKTQMLKFAKNNNITLHEEKEMWEPPKMEGGM